MDRSGLGRKERAALRRIIALLLAFADLADATRGRSRPGRWLVLSILGLGEPVARGYVARLTGVPADLKPAAAVDPQQDVEDGVAWATRLASVFRALAAVLAALPDDAFATVGPMFGQLADAVASHRALLAASAVEPCDSS